MLISLFPLFPFLYEIICYNSSNSSMILPQILGPGMSEKMWEVVIKHARNCDLGKNLYILRGYNFTVTLNAICQIVMMDINGQIYARQELSNLDRVWT